MVFQHPPLQQTPAYNGELILPKIKYNLFSGDFDPALFIKLVHFWKENKLNEYWVYLSLSIYAKMLIFFLQILS